VTRCSSSWTKCYAMLWSSFKLKMHREQWECALNWPCACYVIFGSLTIALYSSRQHRTTSNWCCASRVFYEDITTTCGSGSCTGDRYVYIPEWSWTLVQRTSAMTFWSSYLLLAVTPQWVPSETAMAENRPHPLTHNCYFVDSLFCCIVLEKAIFSCEWKCHCCNRNKHPYKKKTENELRLIAVVF